MNLSTEHLQKEVEAVDRFMSEICQNSEVISAIQQIPVVSEKESFDFVTTLDRVLDDRICQFLSRFGIPVASEEREDSWALTDSEFCWVLDPLDGTTNFVTGCCIYATSLALLENGSPIYGITVDLVSGKAYSSKSPNQAVRHASKAKETRIIACSSGSLSSLSPYKDFILSAVDLGYKLRVIGSQALQLAYVASGSADACLTVEAKGWDDAAGIALIRSFGGDYKSESNGIITAENIGRQTRSVAAAKQIRITLPEVG